MSLQETYRLSLPEGYDDMAVSSNIERVRLAEEYFGDDPGSQNRRRVELSRRKHLMDTE